MSHKDPVCFTCGHSVETPLENVLSDGRPCQVCRDRVLESQPSLLPREPAPELDAIEEMMLPFETPWEPDDDSDGPMRA